MGSWPRYFSKKSSLGGDRNFVMYPVAMRGCLLGSTYLEYFERAQAASQRSVSIEPLMMYDTKCSIAGFNLRDHKELMALTHGL